IQKVEPTEPPQSPIERMATLVAHPDSKIDAAGMATLLDAQLKYEANEARKAYAEAMAAFKMHPPEIVKDRSVEYLKVKYNHATLANVTTCINTGLSEHGLTAAWQTEQIPATEREKTKVRVTCKITHIFGHSESTSLAAEPDNSGSKNAIQAIGSTVTYLQRYTLLALTGLATCEQDDDGVASGQRPPSVRQPTDEEWEVIAEVCKAIPAPPGKRVDAKKVAAICYESRQASPSAMSAVSRIAKWLSDMNRPELFIPENRSDFEIGQDMPGDENSVPDDPAARDAEETAAAKFGEENDQVPCRFDAICLIKDPDNGNRYQVEWLRNAFST
ncbi:hypothetical protein LCGC14_2786110, partial [marine sediment metagenome]